MSKISLTTQRNNAFFSLIIIGTLFVSVFVLMMAVTEPKTSRTSRAQDLNSAFIRVSKGSMNRPDSYIVYVLERKWPYTKYNGNLDIQKTVCDDEGLNCTTTEEFWRDQSGNPVLIQNGEAVISIPANYPISVNGIRVKPNHNIFNLDWSNQILFSVGTTTALFDTSSYFIMPPVESVFSGFNKTSGIPVNFTSKVGYEAPAPECDGSSGQVMYMMKDRAEGYPNPKTPWYDTLKPSGYDKLNSKLHFLGRQKKTGWHDEYLSAWGTENYQLNLSAPLNKNENFKTKVSQLRYGSRDTKYPAHLIVPKWIGWLWGIENPRANEASASASPVFCSLPTNVNPDYYWQVDADHIYLGDYGEVIRLKFYEGENNFLEDDTKGGRREDWYFAKDTGLVRIEVTYFCPASWGNFPNCVPCNQNTDCVLNEFSKDPHIVLDRVQGPFPTPTPGWLQLDMTVRPDSGTAPLRVDVTSTVSGTVSSPYVYSFDCTNDGTWEYREFKSTNALTVFQLCTFATPDTYTLKGQVEGGGFTANDAVAVNVNAPSTPTPTPIEPTLTGGPCNKPGDANGDCKVDGIDYTIWWIHFGQNTSNGPRDGDFNSSGRVDGVDYTIWWLNFGT